MMSKKRIPALLLLMAAMVAAACSCTHHMDRMYTCILIHAGNEAAAEACNEYTYVACPMMPKDEDIWDLYYFRVCMHENFPDVFPEPEMPGGQGQQPALPELPDAVSVTPTPDGAGDTS